MQLKLIEYYNGYINQGFRPGYIREKIAAFLKVSDSLLRQWLAYQATIREVYHDRIALLVEKDLQEL